MNKTALLLLGLVCLAGREVFGRTQDSNAAAAAPGGGPAGEKANITVLKSEITPLDEKGSYSYDIELSDGTKLVQKGGTEPPAMGETESSIVIEGSYAYVAPDGKQISITYKADKNGFQPQGDAIPTANNTASASEGGAPSSAAPTAASSEAPPAAAAAESADAPGAAS